MKRIAFTGHRPNKLYGYNMDNKYYDKLKIVLKDMLKDEIHKYNADTFALLDFLKDFIVIFMMLWYVLK